MTPQPISAPQPIPVTTVQRVYESMGDGPITVREAAERLGGLSRDAVQGALLRLMALGRVVQVEPLKRAGRPATRYKRVA